MGSMDAIDFINSKLKNTKNNAGNFVELDRTLTIHPLNYKELKFEPEYSHYAGRLTT